MNIETFRAYCLQKKGVTEEFPFDANTLVFKVMGKMFALTDVVEFDGINLKVDPEIGAELRDKHDYIQPGYHMNKKHWITVVVSAGAPDSILKRLIDQSYNLVVKGLIKSQRLALKAL